MANARRQRIGSSRIKILKQHQQSLNKQVEIAREGKLSSNLQSVNPISRTTCMNSPKVLQSSKLQTYFSQGESNREVEFHIREIKPKRYVDALLKSRSLTNGDLDLTSQQEPSARIEQAVYKAPDESISRTHFSVQIKSPKTKNPVIQKPELRQSVDLETFVRSLTAKKRSSVICTEMPCADSRALVSKVFSKAFQSQKNSVERQESQVEKTGNKYFNQLSYQNSHYFSNFNELKQVHGLKRIGSSRVSPHKQYVISGNLNADSLTEKILKLQQIQLSKKASQRNLNSQSSNSCKANNLNSNNNDLMCAIQVEKMVPKRVKKLGPFHRLSHSRFKSNQIFHNDVLRYGEQDPIPEKCQQEIQTSFNESPTNLKNRWRSSNCVEINELTESSIDYMEEMPKPVHSPIKKWLKEEKTQFYQINIPSARKEKDFD